MNANPVALDFIQKNRERFADALRSQGDLGAYRDAFLKGQLAQSTSQAFINSADKSPPFGDDDDAISNPPSFSHDHLDKMFNTLISTMTPDIDSSVPDSSDHVHEAILEGKTKVRQLLKDTLLADNARPNNLFPKHVLNGYDRIGQLTHALHNFNEGENQSVAVGLIQSLTQPADDGSSSNYAKLTAMFSGVSKPPPDTPLNQTDLSTFIIKSTIAVNNAQLVRLKTLRDNPVAKCFITYLTNINAILDKSHTNTIQKVKSAFSKCITDLDEELKQ